MRIKIEKKGKAYDGWRCIRCSHEWIPLVDGRPVTCPRCKSYDWDRPRVRRRPKASAVA